MCLSLETLTCIITTRILVELIDLVSSIIIFYLKRLYSDGSTLVRQIPDCDSHSHTLLDLFFSPDPSFCFAVNFPSLGNSDHVVVPVSNDFPSNSKWSGFFHRTVFDFCDYFTDFPWDGVFNFGSSAAAAAAAAPFGE